MNKKNNIENWNIEPKNNFTFWYSKLLEIKAPMPRTKIIHYEYGYELLKLCEGDTPKGIGNFLVDLKRAINDIGYPVFLRTSNTSNKHDWQNSCFLTKEENIVKHLCSLMDACTMANIGGMPWPLDFWIVREMIKTKPLFYAFNKMPITKEFRFFIKDHKIQCYHPYWPVESFQGEITNTYSKQIKDVRYLSKKDEQILIKYTEYVAKHFEGYWSVDWLQDMNGNWFLIDMAVGENSFHYSNCKFKS